MAYPHLKNLEQKTTNSNFERGKLYLSGKFLSNYQCVNKRYFSASVRGQKRYRVLLELGKDDFRAWCSCPYASRGLCKHEVALALEVRNKKNIMLKQIHRKRAHARLFQQFNIFRVYLMHLWNRFSG